MKYYKTKIALPEDLREEWVYFSDNELEYFKNIVNETRERFQKNHGGTPEESPADWQFYLDRAYEDEECIIRLDINGLNYEGEVWRVDLDNPIEVIEGGVNDVTNVSRNILGNKNAEKKIVIPDGVTDIDLDILRKLNGCKEFIVSEGNQHYSSIDGVLYNKDMSILIKYPNARDAKSFSIPERVKVIAPYAFEECMNLNNIEIPEGVEKIGEGAFRCCTDLKEISLPSCGVENIEDHTFSFCTSLEEISLPCGVKNIGYCAFLKCTSLKKINLPDSIGEIKCSAFSSCAKLKDIIVDNYRYRGQEGILFEKLYEDVDVIKGRAIVRFPQTYESSSYVTPDDIICIDNCAFEDCHQLKSIVISGNLEYLGPLAFCNCENLESITIKGNISDMNRSSFGCMKTKHCELHIPKGTAETYKNVIEGESGIVIIEDE